MGRRGMSIWAEITPNDQLPFKKMILRGGPKSFFYMIACLKNINKSSKIASKWLWGSGDLESIEFDKIAYKKNGLGGGSKSFFHKISFEIEGISRICRNLKEFKGI